MTPVVIPYHPRPQQLAIHEGMWAHRWGVAVCHRRLGKTVCAINHLQRAATSQPKPRPRYAYIAPTYRQGKAIAWDYMTHYAAPIPGVTLNVSELRVDYPNGGQVRIYGADNPDSLRGIYLDGAVFDEYGLHPPNIFSEVVRPALSDREGWALFLGTPAGKNQFYDVYSRAKVDADWFCAQFPASATGLLSADELQSARSQMTADEYQQEYECSFEASVKGAIFAAALAAARDAGRVCSVPYDPILPVDTDWDLGVGDATAIWFSQSSPGGEVRLIDYYEATGEGLPHYAQVLARKGYVYGRHTAPHDIEVRELSSGKSRKDIAAQLGISFAVCPNLRLEEGIHAARMLLPRCWFDADKTQHGRDCLMHYRWDWNTRISEFTSLPVHDWACFDPDTNVLTRAGTCRIMDLPENGEVLTPCGWKTYQGPRVTRRNARLVGVTFENGHTVKCTPDHTFLTAGGWISAESLTPNTEILSCSTPSPVTLMVDSIASGLRNAITRVAARNYIERLGSVLSAVSPQVVMCTTGTATRATTPLPIWSASQLRTIEADGMSRRTSVGSTTQPGGRRRSGTIHPRDGSGILDTLFAPRGGLSGSVWTVLASIVMWCIRCLSASLVIVRNTVQQPARPLRIASVKQLSERADTCCIHVPDVECFALANGAIVHNSHGADAYRYLAVRHQTPRVKPLRVEQRDVDEYDRGRRVAGQRGGY